MGARFDLSTTEAAAILRAYGIGGVRDVAPVAEGSVNSTFRVTSERGPFVLTALERHFDRTFFAALSGILDELAGLGAPVSTYLRPPGAAEPVTFHRGRAVVVSRFLGGGSLQTLSSERRVRAVGRSLGQLHLLQAHVDASPVPEWTPPWRRLPLLAGALDAAFTPAEQSYLRGVLDLGASLGCDGVEWGFLHGDVFPGNVVFAEPDRAVLIDFEEARRGPLLLDLATALISCCTGPGGWDARLVRALLAGYRSVRPPAGGESRLLPLMLFVACAEFLFGRLADPAMGLSPRPMFDLLRSLSNGVPGVN